MLTVVAAGICWRVAARRGCSGGLYALLALLVGPGAIPIAARCRESEQRSQQLCLVPVAILGGVSSALLVLSRTVFLVAFHFLDGLSLELPGPTVLLLRLSQSPIVLALWVVAGLSLPALVYQGLEKRTRLDSSDPDRLATEILWRWAALWPIPALALVAFSLLLTSLMLPFQQLVGFVGG